MRKKSIITFLVIMATLMLSLSAFSACSKNKHNFSDEWKYNDEYHWHECTTKKHTDTSEKLAHVWNDGVITTQPTEETEGVKTFTCTECGCKKTVTVSKLAHTHKFNEAVWEHDENNHWHPATCEHITERGELAPHDWNDGKITTPAGYGTAGVKTFTCKVCPETKTEPIAALEAKNNTISFADGLTLEKTYDGKAFTVTEAQVNRNGDGAITITYKGEDDVAFTSTAPTNVGEYTVKATVAATAEWKGGETTETITIEKRAVTLPSGVFDRKLGENLESGKFGLTCVNVAKDTNNVVNWVTIGAPENYYAIGIHTIGAGALTVDNDNFIVNAGSYSVVKFTVWDAPDFYAGINDIFTFSGSSDIVITTTIARGTVNTGDRLLVNEIGKIITVKKIEKGIGSSAIVVETATAGDEVGLRIEGVTKAELNRGYMLTVPDTVINYKKFTATIRSYTKDEGGQLAPIQTGFKPQSVFADTFGDVTCKLAFPEGVTALLSGNTLEGVTVDFQGEIVPAFVGRRFKLRSSTKNIAECIVTAVPPTTSVNGVVSAPAEKTVVIDPIEKGATTFAVNLSRSTAFENLSTTEAVTLVVKYNDTLIGKYSRTGLGFGEGDLEYVVSGGDLVGSYINVNLVKNVSGLTDADGKWISDGKDVTFNVTAERAEQLDNLRVGVTKTVNMKKGEAKYFTLNDFESIPEGWYSFVNAMQYGSSRCKVYTNAGVEVQRLSDMFKSTGGAYLVRYTTGEDVTNAPVGFNAAKAELSATNSTSKLDIPKGKKGDRLVIKVTLRRPTNYFQINVVQISAKVSAFNGAYIRVFKDDYSLYPTQYQALDKPTFRLPNKNAQETFAYVTMEYVDNLDIDLSLSFQSSYVNAEKLSVAPDTSSVGTALKKATFSSKGSEKNFYFDVTAAGKYEICLVEESSPTLVPKTNFGAKLFDTNFNAVSVNSNLEFTASGAGTYYLTLENSLTVSQTVRICILKKS